MIRLLQGRTHLVGVVVGGLLGGLNLLSCGANEDLMRDDIARLEQRVSEMEHSSGRWYVQLGQIEQNVLLLEDRVEAHRLSLERRGQLPQRGREDLPAYRPPSGQPAYTTRTSLPVERVEPPSARETTAGAQESIVIDNSALERFVSERGNGSQLTGSASSREPASLANSQEPRVRATAPSASPVATPVRAAPAQSASSGTRSNLASSQGPQSSQLGARSGSALEVYQESLRLFNSGLYSEAEEGFRAFQMMSPPQNYRDNAIYWLGECRYAVGDYTAALDFFQQVVDEFPDGNKVPDSLLKIGLTYERLNNRSEASQVLAVLVDSYPMSDAARRASERLTQID